MIYLSLEETMTDITLEIINGGGMFIYPSDPSMVSRRSNEMAQSRSNQRPLMNKPGMSAGQEEETADEK
jgi:hypothetical protein